MGHSTLWSALVEQEHLLSCEDGHFDDVRYAELDEIIVANDGYALESRAAEILAGLNIQTPMHNKPLSMLSGGYKLRALLGQTLCSQPDVLF